MAKHSNSPASSGPAGSHFEGQVAAYYLLSVLAGTEPRGLPSSIINRVELQRAGEGFPLDDVIVHAQHNRGKPAVLEIQVKRSIQFTPTDSVFSSVVNQIVEASRKPEFDSIRYELAIATAKSSRKIDGAYQEVLTWARQLGNPSTFFERLERAGSANDDMRSFVNTFKANLVNAGASDDNETVWKLLSKLQILVFDFTTEGSVADELAKERAVRVLHPDDSNRAPELWRILIELSIRVAASGGDRDRSRIISDLENYSFRFTGERRFNSAQAAINEASSNALADIGNQVGTVRLTRHQRVVAVNNALSNGRYVEIRGDSGVGKSAVLKHFAEQVKEEAKPLVFSPNRTIPGGWIAMRSAIGFDGEARDLLSDCAACGSTIIFIDGLEFFSLQERTTIIDLVRAAADIPGFSVIATARREFGIDEPNWLPEDALSKLGIAPNVIIGEITDDEINELSIAAPSLSQLLSDEHPARDVARNLFRLARLARRKDDDPLPLTEVDMANQWWDTADGDTGAGHRERSRVLRNLAEQAISQIGPFDVSEYPATAVDALIASGTLQDFGSDKVSFKHDALREWAIACLTYDDMSLLQRFPLEQPAQSDLARSIELISRATLEKSSDSVNWQSLLENLSASGLHGSWRRNAILAIVRSEIATTLLTRASSLILANDGKLLSETIRLVMAVDVQQATDLLARVGMDTSIISNSLNIPSGASWLRLIIWLHSVEDRLPAAVISDIVDLYTNWSVGTFGYHVLTPSLQQSFYKWLTEIEEAREAEALRDLRSPFGGELAYEQLQALEADLRTGFLLLCHRTPKLAAQYLQELKGRKFKEQTVESILKFRGNLAQAAPAELAELTASALIPTENSGKDNQRRRNRGPFEFTDYQFHPASPSQGPFLDLLTHAPEQGKALIRQLVEHAVEFYSGGQDHGDDAISIFLQDGERTFPWTRSYNWSRNGAGHNCVTSGLMALEGWAHQKIEAGEPFEQVLSDTLGTHNCPAAYLLVAVDLILSHWPQSREAAIPYLACPKLLCIDRERAVNDSVKLPDLFGMNELQKEPAGVISIESLKKRSSRNLMLDNTLMNYAVFEPFEHREALKNMLNIAAKHLGAPDDDSTLRDPRFMAVYALNLIKPENYKKVPVQLKDGSHTEGFEYVSPESEKQHFLRLNQAVEESRNSTDMHLHLSVVVDDPSRSSAEFAAAAFEWAVNVDKNTLQENSEDSSSHEQDIVTVAMIAMRDGNTELREKCADWAHKVFTAALKAEADSVHRFRSGIRFNPCAIAFVGVVHAVRQCVLGFEVRDILEAVSNGNPAAAHSLETVASLLLEIDERLLPSILRIAFITCIKSSKRRWDTPNEEIEKLKAAQRSRAVEALKTELAWIANELSEPNWPDIPELEIKRRRGIRITTGASFKTVSEAPEQRPEEYFDHQAAALWLSNLRNFSLTGDHSWLQTITRTYSVWTTKANGAGLEAHEEVTDSPIEWNNAYYHLLASSLRRASLDEVDEHAIAPICSLPDKSFFDIISTFIRDVDEIFFNDLGLDGDTAIHIRSALAERMMQSRGWKWVRCSRESSIEMHIAPAIAVLLFNQYILSQPPSCYLLSKGIDQLDPFLETTKTLGQNGPSIFLAMATLNLLEVSPRPTHLLCLISVTMSWLEAFSDFTEFWADHGIGRRFCELIVAYLQKDPKVLDSLVSYKDDLHNILSGLISLGIPEAKRLEESLM